MSKLILEIKKILKKKDLFKRFIFALKTCLLPAELYPLGCYKCVDIDRLVDNYIAHMETADFYAKKSNSVYFNFLQPFNGVGRDRFSSFEVQANAHILRRITADGRNEQELIVEFYQKLWKKIENREGVFDLRDIFRSYTGEVYFDQVHCSNIGYDLIAKSIADKIIEQEKKIYKSQNKVEVSV